MDRDKKATDLATYLLGERSELRPLIEAIAEAPDDAARERSAVEYLLVLAAARQAASGQPSERQALDQIRAQYNRMFSRDDSEHAGVVKALHGSLKTGSALEVVTALKLLGLHHRKLGSYRSARASFAVAVELAKLHGDQLEQLNALFWLGVVERYLGNLDRAESVHVEQLELARKVGSRGQAVLAQENLGLVTLRRGQVGDARNRVLKALFEAQELDDRELEGYCYHSLMTVEIYAGRPGEAASAGWEAYRRYESVDQRLRALQDCAVILYQSGLFEAARAAFEMVLERATEITPRIHAKLGLADVAVWEGESERFQTLARELLAEVDRDVMAHEFIGVNHTVGVGFAKFGEPERARKHLEASLELAEEKGYGSEAALAREALASLPSVDQDFAPVSTPPTEYEQLQVVSEKIMAERARAIA